MSRLSSGTVAASSAAWIVGRRGLTGGSPIELELGLGVGLAETVGNSPTGLPGEVPVPAIGGSDAGGSVIVTGGLAELDGLGGGETATTSVAELVNERAFRPEAVADSCTCSPSAAFRPTFTVSWSSSACPGGRLPTAQVAPWPAGHTVNRGEPTYAA